MTRATIRRVSTFGVSGLTCPDCLVLLMERVRHLHGVREVTVDLEPAGESSLTIAPAEAVSAEDIRALVDEIGFAPLDDTGAQLLFRFVAATYERRSLGIASHHSFEDWGRFLPEHTTAVSLLDRLLHHATTVVTSGQSYRMREAKTRTGGSPTTS